MRQELLTDIELDVQQIKYLMGFIPQGDTPELRMLLKRNVLQMKERLDQMLIDLDSSSQIVSAEPVLSALGELASIPSIPEESIAENPVAEPPVVKESIVEEQVVEEPIQRGLVVEASVESVSVVEAVNSAEVREEMPAHVLGETIWASADFRRAISLNDAFRFTRELFGGDSDLMNRVIEQISAMSTLNAAIAFLASKVAINEENEVMVDFLELLKKHFKSA